MTYTVRCATASDSSAVRQLLLDLSHHCPVTDLLLRPDFSVEDLQQHRVLCYLCFETTAQLPVGLCIASRTYYTGTGPMLSITGVYVDSGHRRRGICSAMVQAILRDDSVKDITRVNVDIPESEGTAQIVFVALGFQHSSGLMNYKLSNDAYEQLISKPTRPDVSACCLDPCEEGEKSSAFKLRLATAEDVGDILRFVIELLRMHNSLVSIDTNILQRDMTSGCFFCVLVEDSSNGRTVGLCFLASSYSISHGQSGRIAVLILETEYRGKGLGGALIQTCCQVAKSKGIEFVHLQLALWNVGGRKIYEHLGFVKDSVVSFVLDGENLHQLRTREVMLHIH